MKFSFLLFIGFIFTLFLRMDKFTISICINVHWIQQQITNFDFFFLQTFQQTRRSLVTCSWHIFTNSESTNLCFFFTKNVLFSFKGAAKCRGFVDSEFVKACHEHGIAYLFVIYNLIGKKNRKVLNLLSDPVNITVLWFLGE